MNNYEGFSDHKLRRILIVDKFSMAILFDVKYYIEEEKEGTFPISQLIGIILTLNHRMNQSITIKKKILKQKY